MVRFRAVDGTSAGQQGDRLHVVRVREQVDRAHAAGLVPERVERREIAGERHRVAGHVHHGGRIQLHEAFDDLASSACTRRIEDDDAVPQPGPLRGGCRRLDVRQPPVHATGLGARTNPVGEIHARVLGGARVGLDGGHTRLRSAELGDGCRQQPHPAVQIQMPRLGVYTVRLAKRVADGLRQRRRSEPVHLPETAGIHLERARPDPLDDDLTRGGVTRRTTATPPTWCRRPRNDANTTVGGLDEIEATGDCGASLQRRARDVGRRQRQFIDLDHVVAARRERSDAPVRVDVQPDPRPPSRTVRALTREAAARVGVGRLDRDRDVDPADPVQRVADDPRLELALMAETDVAEVSASGTLLRGHVDIGLPPDVPLTIRRGVQDIDDLAPPERRLPGVGKAHAHPFAGDRVGDEDDTVLVTADEDPAVGDVGDVKVDEVCLLHATSIPHGPRETAAALEKPVPASHTTAVVMLHAESGFSLPRDVSLAGRVVRLRRTRCPEHPAGSVDAMRVCLASTSPARLMLLRQAGIEPLVRAPQVDEEAVVAEVEAREGRVLAPDEHVLLLARRKAADVAETLRAEDPGFDGVVIGGDSMFELDGEILGKPYRPEIATARWRAMRGRTGILHSGHSVFRLAPGVDVREAHAVAEASVSFAADVSDVELDAYVASGEPLHVAGAFTIDSLGGPFIDRVVGDPSTVVGMSLSTVRRLTTRLGVGWTDLWNRERS